MPLHKVLSTEVIFYSKLLEYVLFFFSHALHLAFKPYIPLVSLLKYLLSTASLTSLQCLHVLYKPFLR